MSSNSTTLLIKQAQILLQDGTFLLGDVRINNGHITEVASSITPNETDRVIDATGLTLLPVVIDPQVHFREPGLEHKEDLSTASLACARGGVTSFLEMPNTKPLTCNQAALDDKLQRAASKSLVNYGFFIGATANNIADLLTVESTCGIKIFMGSSHGPLLVSTEEEIESIFAQGTRLIAVHAEDQARIVARQKQFKVRSKKPEEKKPLLVV